MNCILCQSPAVSWHEDKSRPYYRCETCSFIFVPRTHLLSASEEKKRYDTHENFEEDLRYREYLTKIRSGITPFLNKGEVGLDFGCGASTLLERIFSEAQFKMDSFDLYYHPNEKIWQNSYDFIVLSEVIEHLADPVPTMEKLAGLLRPGGQFFIKTMFAPIEAEKFGKWFYKNDPTHIQFFNFDSMGKLASMLGMQGPLKLESPDLYRVWS